MSGANLTRKSEHALLASIRRRNAGPALGTELGGLNDPDHPPRLLGRDGIGLSQQQVVRELPVVADLRLHPWRHLCGCARRSQSEPKRRSVIHAKVGVGVISESNSYSELLETRDKISGLMEQYTYGNSVFHVNEDLEVAVNTHGV